MGEPAWPGLAEAIAAASVPVVVLPGHPGRGREVLARLGVSEASTLGALAVNCGGLLVDHGWLRILGGGSDGLPDLATANGLSGGGPPPHLVVAYDALGGVFAIDGGGLDIAPGEVCYRGPDTTTWDSVGAGHTAFVHAALSGGLDEFFGSLRWPGWEQEVSALGPERGLSLYPPPFTAEGHDVASVSRRPIPFFELLAFYDDLATQIADLPDGQTFTFKITQ